MACGEKAQTYVHITAAVDWSGRYSSCMAVFSTARTRDKQMRKQRANMCQREQDATQNKDGDAGMRPNVKDARNQGWQRTVYGIHASPQSAHMSKTTTWVTVRCMCQVV